MSTSIENPDLRGLIEQINLFCAKSGISKTKFGKLSVNDYSFVSELEKGRELRFSTIQRVRRFMEQASDTQK